MKTWPSILVPAHQILIVFDIFLFIFIFLINLYWASRKKCRSLIVFVSVVDSVAFCFLTIYLSLFWSVSSSDSKNNVIF